jgi:site-specific recombinase XerD
LERDEGGGASLGLEGKLLRLHSSEQGTPVPWCAKSQSEYVFAKPDARPYKSVQNIFQTACKKAGLTDILPHVMSHTFWSRLAMAGVDACTIQELGPWSSLAMVQRYVNLSKSHKAEAIEKLSAGKEC